MGDATVASPSRAERVVGRVDLTSARARSARAAGWLLLVELVLIALHATEAFGA